MLFRMLSALILSLKILLRLLFSWYFEAGNRCFDWTSFEIVGSWSLKTGALGLSAP